MALWNITPVSHTGYYLMTPRICGIVTDTQNKVTKVFIRSCLDEPCQCVGMCGYLVEPHGLTHTHVGGGVGFLLLKIFKKSHNEQYMAARLPMSLSSIWVSSWNWPKVTHIPMWKIQAVCLSLWITENQQKCSTTRSFSSSLY